jgi:hypothetical protein
MFLQHHSTALSQVLSQSTSNSEDFELIIKSKSESTIKGKICFEYLQQSFQAQIVITESSIKVVTQYPFAGILASAPVLSTFEIEAFQYLHKGSLTKNGHQNIVWLILDLIHLYNLLRFKPASILELYRDAFAFAKEQDNSVIFGQLSLEAPIAKATAKVLGQKAKRKTKYAYGNNLDLLASFQEILASYPQQFLLPKANLAILEPALS